ncbi:RNase adapter RapZ [Maritimibacter sp. UBA3975]|uniref:RNase adapter RapZ n=1 Tax=Maritimibacter sp. UBA3975 TaxID=1946833 RepID=UPI000C0B42CD|nr:RNase adapter RapZ [Maritimibacter sp. UBA3975]MAM61800.1 RNase adapter RapZ [Maritimibacter sp.]|tara:strand:- start:10886 stop:11770 length:885 start_codon:yes stop_codon:yes gene_type:complete
MSETTQTETPPSVVLVTGPSGAGRTTAIRVFEDLGYESIDNLPISMIPRLLHGSPPDHPIALGIDVRNRDFSTAAVLDLIDAGEAGWSDRIQVLFLDCRPDVLVNRYSETRRRHPLAPEETPEAGIARETDLLQPIRVRADVLIDTSEMSPHELKAELLAIFDPEDDTKLSLSVQSFSYKRGVPRGLDLVFDVRFLNNPHWEPALRKLTGRAQEVADYVARDPRYAAFTEKTLDLLEFLLPAYAEEGKAHLAVGFGCTGGRHRSVTLAESMAKALADKGWQVSIRHRELERHGI